MFEEISLSVIIIVLAVLAFSITLHEAMHAFTSYWLGDDTAEREGRITLNPIRHVDPFLTILLPIVTLIAVGAPVLAAKPVPFNPARVRFEEFGAALVGIVGPFTNLLLAIAGAGIWNLFQGSLGAGVLQALYIFIAINIGLFVFNMIPVPPLDGSRLLYAFAPEALQRVMAQLEQYGIFIVFALVLLVPGFGQLVSSIMRELLTLLI